MGFGQLSEPDKLTSGSIYSSIGLGTPVDHRASYASGMGLVGYSLYDSYAPSLANPALWGRNVLTQATSGVNLFRYNAKDRSSSTKNAHLSLSMFQMVFPLKKDKVSLSVSLHPLTQTSFTAFKQVTLPPSKNAGRDSLTYGIENHGSGGLNRLELGAGWKISEHLSVGYAGSYIFGPVENERSVYFSSNEYRQIRLTQTTTHHGFGNRFGVLVSPVNVFSSNDRMNIGLTASLPVNLKTDRFVESDKQVANRIRTVTIARTSAITAELPMKFGGGINYQPNSLWDISGEVKYENWSATNRFADQQSRAIVDRYRVGMGARYKPYFQDVSTFWSRFKYNFGVTYDTGYLKLQGNRVETVKFSAGLGILSPDTRSSVDLNFHYGLRGTTTSGLVRERIWGFRMSFNLAELMFFRRKLQ